MSKIIFTKESKFDLEEIKDYICQDNPAIAKKVIDIIINLIINLATFPKLWHSIDWTNFREIIEPMYNYNIRYKIIDEVIYIITIYKFKNI